MLLRLSYWGKILSMSMDRLVRRVYEAGRARLETNKKANTWCNLTRLWLSQLGLEKAWELQTVGSDWKEALKQRIMAVEEQRWKRGVTNNARLENYSGWKARLTMEAELYLKERESNKRRLWTKLRAGCLELRVETGRWEWMSVAGVQKKIPRWARMCPLCFGEVEDAEHTLFKCAAYAQMRSVFLLGAGLTGDLEQAAQAVLSGGRGRERELWSWMMSGAGVKKSMRFLEHVMEERAMILK